MNPRPTHILVALLAFLTAVMAAGAAHAASLKIAVTRDNSIILVNGEERLNHGDKRQIRIKGNQHIVALGFDASPLRGRKIARATLVCRKGEESIQGLTISTIQAPWDEMRSNALSSGAGNGEGWSWPGAKFPSVCGGNSGSLLCQAPSRALDGWYRWEVEPDLVHALATGMAYGLALHEWETDYRRNPTIHSREDRENAPYLLVEFAEGNSTPPEPPQDLQLTHSGRRDGMQLKLTSPPHGFGYRVRVNDRELPRWNIPFVRAGETQTVHLRDLGPLSEEFEVKVVAVNRIGHEGPEVSIRGRRPAQTGLPQPKIQTRKTAGAAAPGLTVRPELDRVTRTGALVGGSGAQGTPASGIWDGERIQLAAAAGEVVGFQIGLRGRGRQTVTCRLEDFRVDVLRGVYVSAGNQQVPDPLLPVNGEVVLSPDEETPLWVDVYVPFETRPGEIAGEFSVGDGRRVPIHLKVRPFSLPRKASFLCEMNTYGFPEKVSEFYRLQEIAYDHRVHVNVVHYSHGTAQPGSRQCTMDMRKSDGRRMNEAAYNDIGPGDTTTFWDDFVEVFGPHLSGSHYAGGHRGAIPAPGFYLTFHESWPLHVREFWSGDMDAYEGFKARPEYAATYESLVKDFVRVAEREKWSAAGFQIYFNNKPGDNDPRKNPWTLDEPASFWDYRALNFYRDLTDRGCGKAATVPLKYRIDISRPQFSRGQLSGAHDLWVVSHNAFRQYGRTVLDRVQETGEEVWLYGSTSKPEHSARETQAWALDAYRSGATGVVPWQTVDKSGKALSRGDQLGLFIFDRADSDNRGVAIRHSVRLKAYRRAQQDIEYLELVKRLYGLSLADMQDFMDRHLALDGRIDKRSERDAGTTRHEGLDPAAFSELREAAARLIEMKLKPD